MRAQMWSLDFAVSVVIFAFVVSIVVFAWNYSTQNSMDQVNFNILQNDVMMISDSLIRVSGLPEDWNDTNVQVIGLADEENVLNSTKVLRFIGLDYGFTKSILGIGNYDFYFDIRYPNNTIMEISGTTLTKGIHPVGQDSRIVVPVERYVILDGNVGKMEFFLWV